MAILCHQHGRGIRQSAPWSLRNAHDERGTFKLFAILCGECDRGTGERDSVESKCTNNWTLEMYEMMMSGWGQMRPAERTGCGYAFHRSWAIIRIGRSHGLLEDANQDSRVEREVDISAQTTCD